MIELRILGPIELTGGRDPRAILSHPRDLALLAYVSTAGAGGGSVSREQVAAVFWSDSDTKRARNALNQALHRIRRATADDVFAAVGRQALRLNDRCLTVDVCRFHELLDGGERAEALTMYRGPLLDGFHIRRAGAFERWLDKEQVRLGTAARDAARHLRDRANDGSDAAKALHWARRAVQISNREEKDVRRLIELLEASGDRVAALRVFGDFERWMLEELGLQPSPETRSLVTEIVEPDARVRAPQARPTPESASASSGDAADDASGAGVRRREGRKRVRTAAFVVGAVAVAWVVRTPFLGEQSEASSASLELSDSSTVYYERGQAYAGAGNAGDREENWRLALEMFQRAAELSPRSAAAEATVGVAHLRLFHWGFDRSTERQVLAKTAIDRGVELNPDHPEVTRALGWYYQWAERDYARALAAGQRTLQSQPDDPDALLMVFAALRRLGRAQEAVPMIERLVQQSPTAAMRREWAATHLGLREYAPALEIIDASLDLFPNDIGLHYRKWLTVLLATGDTAAGRHALEAAQSRVGHAMAWPMEFGLHWLSRRYSQALGVLEREEPEAFSIQQGDFPIELMYGLVYRLAGHGERAREAYVDAIEPLEAKVRERPGEPWFHGWLAVALAGAGDADRAMAEAEVARDLVELEPDRWENPFFVQEVLMHAYLMAGERDRAVETLDRLLASRHYRAVSRAWLRMDPRFDGIRDDPRLGGVGEWSERGGPTSIEVPHLGGARNAPSTQRDGS